MNTSRLLLVSTLCLGAFAAGYALKTLGPAPEEARAASETKPLYWVAPMDPNYRRDAPGKSPMGMDLIPVYPEDLAGQSSPGLVRIDPSVAQNLGVRTGSAEFGPLYSQIETVGYISYDEDRLHHLHPRVNGWIEQLAVKSAGEQVKQGQRLFELYSPELVNAQFELLQAQRSGNRTLIRSSIERLRVLGVDDQQINAIRKAREVRQRIEIKAPADGYITQLGVREGMYVTPSVQIMELGALDEVWVIAEVFERQAAWLASGLNARMETEFLPGQVLQGQLDYIYPDLDPNSRTLRVRLRFANPGQKLKPNMFARVTIDSQASQPVVSVPREALIRSGRMERVVLALGNGEYRSVRVRAGREAGDRVEILEGLAGDEEVVTSAQFLIDSESSISADFSRIHNPQPAAAMDQSPMQGMDHAQMNQAPMPEMDHSQMDHSPMPEMDHSQMNHDSMPAMDHSQMNHSQMPAMDHAQMDHAAPAAKEETSQ